MRRGCISLGDTKCDSCHRIIRHGERYLAIDEDSVMQRLCLDCSLEKGYAQRRESKREEILTFFSGDLTPL
jgi:RNase P subunit RPR2